MSLHRRSLLAQLAVWPLIGCGGGGGGPPAPVITPTTGSAWQQDLDEVGQLLRSAHVAPFARLPEADYETRARALRERMPALSDGDAICELMALVAALGDGHTSIYRRDLFQSLPVGFGILRDGVFITQATEAWQGLQGAELLGLGELSAAEAVQRAARYWPHENVSSRMASAEWMLSHDRVLRHADLCGPGPCALRLRLRGSATELQQELPFSTRPALRSAITSNEPSLEGLAAAQPFVWRWWPDGDRDVMALRYRRCEDAGGFAQLCEALFRALDQRPSSAVVVDLRSNPGGDSSVFRPFINGLEARGIRGPRRLGVLTNRYTFSAGMDALLDLLALGALHAGEAPGQRPNFLGNARVHTTRNKGLSLQYPTRVARRVPGDPSEQAPALPVALDSTTLLAGGDNTLRLLLAALR